VGCSANLGKKAGEKICPSVVLLLVGIYSKSACDFTQENKTATWIIRAVNFKEERWIAAGVDLR
jgi:hypothetical protein